MLDGRVALLASEPEGAALILDVDGTLAPIVERPEQASVPAETQRCLRRLAARYALVACLSGRAGADARRVVGVPELVYVGSHGLELAPEAQAWQPLLREFAASSEWPVEDKGVTLSFHYRGAADELAARAYLEQMASTAREAGLEARFGRKVLELRPPVRADKGTAVVALLAGRGVRRALYAGDDTTDLDAFRGLAEADLELALRVAVDSPEAPPALLAAADAVVSGTGGVLELLRSL